MVTGGRHATVCKCVRVICTCMYIYKHIYIGLCGSHDQTHLCCSVRKRALCPPLQLNMAESGGYVSGHEARCVYDAHMYFPIGAFW